MPNEFNDGDELTPLPADIAAAFKAYPRPTASAEFDTRFWSELDTRKQRYGGVVGLWRRLLEVEIEGIAVWRLGFSLFSGAALCAVIIAILCLLPTTTPLNSQRPHRVESDEIPTAASYFARGLFNNSPIDSRHSSPKTTKKERTSCASFVHNWA